MTSKTKLMVALTVGGLVFWSTPARAQSDCHGVYSQMCAYSSSSGSGSSISIQDIIRSFTDRAQAEAVELNNQANERVRAGDEDGALALYRRAHDRFEGDAVIRMNLIRAILVKSRYANIDDAGRLLREIDGLNNASLRNDSRYDAMTTDLAELRARVNSRRGLEDASNRISNISGELAERLGNADGRRTPGLDFGPPPEAAARAPAPEPLVVSASGALTLMPPGLPRLEEVEHSPGYEAWLRGMDAVRLHDWELAKAWFQTAQLRDPRNPALMAATDIAVWTRAYYRQAPRMVPVSVPVDATGVNPNAVLRAPQDADMEFMRDLMNESRAQLIASLTPAERTQLFAGLTPQERSRLEAGGAANNAMTPRTDADALFEQAYQDAIQQRRDQARDAELMNEIFSRGPLSRDEEIQRVSEALSSMSAAEIQDAQRTHSDPEFMSAARRTYARNLTHIAIRQAAQGDVDGANFLLSRAVEVVPESTTHQVVRDAFRFVTTAPPGGITGLAPGDALGQQPTR